MTKYAIASTHIAIKYKHVYSVSEPNKDGVIIRQVDDTHALIIWDDEEVFESLLCDDKCEGACGEVVYVELCELDG